MNNNDNNMFGQTLNEDIYENKQVEYQGQQGMYQNQQMGYQGQQGMYPNQQMGYQSQQGAYPNQQMGYQGQQGGYPNQQMGYQGQQGMYPNQQMGYQGQQGMYPNPQMDYQGEMGMYPNDNTQIPNDNFDMATISEYKQRLRGMKEVQDLTSEVEIQNPNSIVMFGQKASENISKVSDELLKSMKAVKSEEASEMLVNLTKIMDKFDVKGVLCPEIVVFADH